MQTKVTLQRKPTHKSFTGYFRSLADSRPDTVREGWIASLRYFEQFAGGVRFDDVDERFCDEFRDYLLSTNSLRTRSVRLAHNSAVSYYSKFLSALHLACRDGLLPAGLSDRVDPISEVETQRNYLTMEELNRLASVRCGDELLKRAALFSCLTGIRFCDIEKMIWSEVERVDGQGWIVRFTQRKTGGVETMPVSDQAAGFMGDRRGPDDRVFYGLNYSAASNRVLARWIRSAGISKKITFHCFRHTFATLQLSLGTDIYTVSKMLGHRDLKTTQVYARIVDQTKREAAGRIRLG
jgi:integrase